MTLEDFMRSPRTAQEVEGYHAILAHLQALDMVDDQLRIVEPGK